MVFTNKFPLYLPGALDSSNDGLSIISTDLQEEVSTFGHYHTIKGAAELKTEKTYNTKEFVCFADMVKKFREDAEIGEINRLSVGFPGPVINNRGTSLRLPWVLETSELVTKTGIPEVFIINDLEATAYGLANLTENSLLTVHEGDTSSKGNVAILSPGNGLGEAGLYYDGSALRPFATEGGHSEFSPRTNVEVEFYQFLNKIYGIVSWESVLSKNGLFNIFRFLRDEKRHPQSEKFLQRLREEKEFCPTLYEAAMEDHEQICTIAINTYLEFLAREANNLVLKLKATGGLIIGGELPNLFIDYIDKQRFYEKFKISDKMEGLLKGIPIYLLVNDKMVMNGAATFAAFSK